VDTHVETALSIPVTLTEVDIQIEEGGRLSRDGPRDPDITVKRVDRSKVGVECSTRATPHNKQIIDETSVEEAGGWRRTELTDKKPKEEVGNVRRRRDAHREAVDLLKVLIIEAYIAGFEDERE
jgi:hypothetical protein